MLKTRQWPTEHSVSRRLSIGLELQRIFVPESCSVQFAAWSLRRDVPLSLGLSWTVGPRPGSIPKPDKYGVFVCYGVHKTKTREQLRYVYGMGLAAPNPQWSFVDDRAR